ncbi:MAG: SOS response-associated peptidase [Firmicutes bacterium]|nr:SOS response-associated peptidase [Bacillota bacterium]
MCYRLYFLTEFKHKLNKTLEDEGLMPVSFQREITEDLDVHPSEKALIISERKGMIDTTEMVWGFSSPFGKNLIANARSETVRDKAMFADSIASRRCVIPASGFYEWDVNKARYRFFMPDEGLVLLAGIYRPEQGTDRFTVLTTSANASMAPIHDRMPVMISKGEIRSWIDDENKTDEILRRRQFELDKEQDAGQISMFI